MNIQNIKIVDKDNIVITTTEGETLKFEKNKLTGPHRSWFDNIMSTSLSLVMETSQK
jgi:hypothetical protein